MEQLPSAAIAAMAAKARRVSERPPFECIALLLQGGGALGSYQAGVYAALAEAAELAAEFAAAGISIGAINGALIGDNRPRAARRAAGRSGAHHSRAVRSRHLVRAGQKPATSCVAG